MTCMYIVCTIYIFNFPAPFYAEFPRLQYKRAGTSNIFLSFSIQFLYVSCLVATGGPKVLIRGIVRLSGFILKLCCK